MAIGRLLIIRHLVNSKRFSSIDSSSYVNKVKLFEYWNQSDHALEGEFPHSQAVLMVDKEPLVEIIDNNMKLVRFETSDLRQRLNQYGLEIGLLNSCLLDVVGPNKDQHDFRPLFGSAIRTMEPPSESGIDAKQLRKQLASSLGGRFQNLRMAMLNLHTEEDQNLLARFQTLTRWALTFRRCPVCTATLRVSLSKFSAKCIRCQQNFYPTINPVAITLVRDESNEHCLLVKHLGSLSTIYTLIAGFTIAGESIQETVKREIAEEVGILVRDIQALNLSQSWPIPYNSAMLGFTAVGNPTEPLNISPGELDTACWFDKAQVKEAMDRTNADPFLKGALKLNQDAKNNSNSDFNAFRYIPPRGAIAHFIIKGWLDNKF